MIEVLKAKIFDTDQEIDITDPEPLASAVKFKAISDAIWEQKPEEIRLNSHRRISAVPPAEAMDMLNEIVADIDDKFVIAGIGKALDLGQVHGQGESVVIAAHTMDMPSVAKVQTFNWDNRNDHRLIELDGERTVVEFVDGHKDYHRELGIKFGFGNGTVATYGMQRMQPYQNQTTNLYLNVWNVAFAEMGYEGHQILHAPITEQQEDRILTLAQSMTGLEIQ